MRCPCFDPPLVARSIPTPMYGLPLSQSDQRIRSVFQLVYNNMAIDPLISRKFEDMLRIWLLIVAERAELNWHA